MTILFVSDLHLSDTRPAKLGLFRELMAGPARAARAFYILGDLFDDFWVGMDDQSPLNLAIMAILKDYSACPGTRLYVMRGNRDFHLDRAFAEASGCELITDPHELVLGGEKILLLHGDTLCTDDVSYQRWRRFITHPAVKRGYALLPLALRKRVAHGVRNRAVAALRKKAPRITDVAQSAVNRTMNKYAVRTLVHGHTHRQAMHDFRLNNTGARRIVLGDWYERDCLLIYDQQGFRFSRARSYIDRAG